ncbi:hypothetical protein L6164_028192 [Bauhinia variegata]|uniref:Uncharacterized protein n=1 Tax=Bauhinia variegata TaxID=167791 RepID=A0ACB9LV46_BAUVA|nr:hypothetical protein L6164_028192 [Bauhinia variegata]
MGKAAKWFRSFLGLKSSDSSSSPKPPKERRRWSFVKSYREKDLRRPTTTKPTDHHTIYVAPQHEPGLDPDKHAIAVAAATAAVAEAAVAAAQAAAAVVRLTSSGHGAGNAAVTARNNSAATAIREQWAAIKIQAAFRGFLARKALRALKGLVKLQALVRGHIDRKRTAEWVQRMQVFLRTQARARVGRAQVLQTSYSNAKQSNSQPTGPATPDKFESPVRSKSLKHDQSLVVKRNGIKSNVQISGIQEGWNRSESRVDEQSRNGLRSRTCSVDDEKSVRVLEIDSGKPYLRENRRNLFHSAHYSSLSDQYGQCFTNCQSGHSLSCCECEVQSYSPQKIDEVEESPFRTADSSPQFCSASSSRDGGCGGGSKTSPFTPSRSDGSRSGYSDYPSYMAYTESSKAKVRSLSAPKQRPSSSSSSNRDSGDSRLAAQRASVMHASFTSKAYPGSGRLDKLGMPVGYRF